MIFLLFFITSYPLMAAEESSLGGMKRTTSITMLEEVKNESNDMFMRQETDSEFLDRIFGDGEKYRIEDANGNNFDDDHEYNFLLSPSRSLTEEEINRQKWEAIGRPPQYEIDNYLNTLRQNHALCDPQTLQRVKQRSREILTMKITQPQKY